MLQMNEETKINIYCDVDREENGRIKRIAQILSGNRQKKDESNLAMGACNLLHPSRIA